MYCAIMVMSSLANLGLVLTVSRDAGRLMGGITTRERLYRAARAASPGIAFGLGLVLLFCGQRLLSQLSFLLIPLQIAVYGRALKPKAETSA
jgi:hypothetical protein